MLQSGLFDVIYRPDSFLPPSTRIHNEALENNHPTTQNIDITANQHPQSSEPYLE